MRNSLNLNDLATQRELIRRCTKRNDRAPPPLSCMSHVEISGPLFRAMKIYSRVAGHDLDHQARRALARHIQGLANQGVRDPGRLTVHGLSYLRKLDRQPTSP